MHFRLFNKPAAFDIEAGNPKGKMWIDGIYEDYYPGEPYEGFVQIHGSVGLCTVKIIDSNLPPGASVYIDQVLKRVIVKWDKYTPPTEEVKIVPNGSFDEGYKYWEIVGPGTPITFETGWSPNNKGNCTYRDRKGEYKILGAWAPVSSPSRQIEITGKVEHGKSSKGNASCAVGLAWFDKDRNLIREDWGNEVRDGGKGRWYDTKLFISAKDKEIKFVRPALKFNRRKQNHPIHAGQIQWDHVYVIGYDEDEQLFLEVEVTDSIHNKARHRGVIDENNFWITSQPFGYAYAEGIQAQGHMDGAQGWDAPKDSMFSQGSFVSAVIDEVVKYQTYGMNDVFPQSSGAFVSAELEVKVKYSTYDRAFDVFPQSSGAFVSASIAIIGINRTLPAENIQPGAAFINAEIKK